MLRLSKHSEPFFSNLIALPTMLPAWIERSSSGDLLSRVVSDQPRQSPVGG